MKFLKVLLTTLLLASPIAKADPPAVHGMLLFGDQATYASHLPMFHEPHDYQLILKLQLSTYPRSLALISYGEAKAAGKTLFTIAPEEMDLSEIIAGTKTTFTALMYDGHFERGGRNLGPVKVTIEKIINAAKLDGSQAPSPIQTYILFGQDGEYYGAHIIKSKPSFDVITKISHPEKLQLCRMRVCQNLFIPDDELPVYVPSDITQPVSDQVLGHPDEGQSLIEKVIYFEKDELSH